MILITPEEFGADREQIRLALEAENIESRPVWKAMHLQPVFNSQISPVKSKAKGHLTGQAQITADSNGKMKCPCRMVEGTVSEDLFNRGLCLPSGTAMTDADLDRVISVILKCRKC